jgi:hypothetical protein
MSSTRTENFYKSHHSIAQHLDLVDWLIIGHITFPAEISHQKENHTRSKLFRALMTSVAMVVEVKTKKLVYFQNNEVEPKKDFYHIHFLLGRHGFENVEPETICRHLAEQATKLKMHDSQFVPYDPSRDGVGYVTKKVYKNTQNHRYEEMPLDYYVSQGLVRFWKEKGIE